MGSFWDLLNKATERITLKDILKERERNEKRMKAIIKKYKASKKK